jgi:hypothetical protein
MNMGGNFNESTRQMIGFMALGLRVDRANALHKNVTHPYFTVVGQVLLTGLVGLVNTACGANACVWTHVPTAGTSTDLCVAADINTAVVGDLIGITGVLATALTFGGAVVQILQPVALTAGTLDFHAAAADGYTSWSLWYIPLSDGATVTST